MANTKLTWQPITFPPINLHSVPKNSGKIESSPPTGRHGGGGGIYHLSTGNTQVIHRLNTDLSTSYPQGYPQVIHKEHTGLTTACTQDSHRIYTGLYTELSTGKGG
jgi:hypothetical protein